jgi:hypothetical protein
MSSYTGIYVQRLSEGTVCSVQVEDSFGNSLSLDPLEYQRRKINPPFDKLPDINDYQQTKTSNQ